MLYYNTGLLKLFKACIKTYNFLMEILFQKPLYSFFFTIKILVHYCHSTMRGKQGKIEFCSTIIVAHPSRTQIKRKKFSPAPPVVFRLSFVWDIISSMGGAGADPPSSKKGMFFLMPLDKSWGTYQTQAVSKLCEPALRITMTSLQSAYELF